MQHLKFNMQQFLCVILHGSMHNDRYENIMNTWGKMARCLFYSDHSDEEKNIIKVSDRKDYHSNEDKFVNIFQRLPEEQLVYDWYLFCDNDTFVNINLLRDSLETLSEDVVYGQKINTWPKDPSLSYISGGGGILMSKKMVLHAREHFKYKDTGYSDVSYGLYVRENDIKIADDKRFHSQPPEHYFIKVGDAAKHLTFHYIKTMKRMQELHDRCNK